MELLIVVLGIAVLALPVIVIALWIGHSRLRQRTDALERRANALAQVVEDLTKARGISAEEAKESSEASPIEIPTEAEPASADEMRIEPDEALAARLVAEESLVAPVAAETAPASAAWDKATRTRRADAPKASLVKKPDTSDRLLRWVVANWVYVVSAVSLALAGIFLVQYGVERGLLPPAVRVLAAVAFGFGLIGVGEWMRRRHGDEGAHRSAQLPSVFSGAGLVSIFAATLAARQLYGLIGPQTAFAGHLVTAALAVFLGWFYGPFLVAFGLVGAAVSPFIVAGGSEAGPWLYGYYALIGAVGLAVDAVRRWGWVSVLSLVLAYGGGALVYLSGAGLMGWMVFLLAMLALTIILPRFRLIPDHPGPALLMWSFKSARPSLPVLLAAAAVLVSVTGIMLMAGRPEAEAMLALMALTGMVMALLFWADRAEGLADLAYAPALGFLAALTLQGMGDLPLQRAYLAAEAASRAPEAPAPMTAAILLAMAVLIGLAFGWRSLRAGFWHWGDTAVAVLLPSLATLVLHLTWHPVKVVGAYPWALHVMAVAAVMVGLALRYARADAPDRRRFAHATLAALSLIALALFSVTSATPLTLALAVLVVVVAELDRRFDLPEMRFFIQIGAAVLWFRLFANPGIDWAMVAPLGQVMLAFGGVIAAFVAALRLLETRDRPTVRGVLESAALGLVAVLLNVVITRRLIPEINTEGLETYWGASINAMPWSILMLVQLYRLRMGGPLRLFRQIVAVVAGVLAGGGLFLAALPLNPMLVRFAESPRGQVEGPLMFDSLALAYGVPALLFMVSAALLKGLSDRLRRGFWALGGSLAVLYVGMEIRRFWQGRWLGAPGVEQGELYNYTVALMLVGAVLLYLAIARRSGLLRRIAMAVIGFTIVKVFLLDAAGLSGLTRVVSFLGLGLSLAGLAWLNRWAGQATESASPK